MGSIPVRVTKPEKAPRTVVLFLFLGLGVPYAHRTHSRFTNYATHNSELLVLQIITRANMGSYTPPEDPKARFQGSEAARRSKKTIDNRFPLSVTEPKREGGGYIQPR